VSTTPVDESLDEPDEHAAQNTAESTAVDDAEAQVIDLGAERRRRGDRDDDQPAGPDADSDVDEDDEPVQVFRPLLRVVARQPAYLAAGARTVVRRTWESRTTARHERMMRAAEALGDHEAVLEWEARAATFRKERHERRMAMLAIPVHVVRALAFTAVASFAFLLLLGITLALADHHLREVVGPLMAAVQVVRFLVYLTALLYRPVLAAGVLTGLGALWRIGRERGELPLWLAPAHQLLELAGEPITPSIVVTALRDLGLSELRKKIKEMGDAGAGMLSVIRPAGCGVELDVALPSGVSTEEVQGRHKKLAENLGRHEHELFITIPRAAARTVRLWIADFGALDEPIGPSPLVTDPSSKADYFTGRGPWGVNLRGDLAAVSLHQRHVLVTGTSNQGKTAALRALALWLALDRRVRFWIGDLKGVGDWIMFLGLAELLIQGPTDEHVMDTTHMAEAAVQEMQQRGVLMQELTAKDWTQEQIMADRRFDPLVVIVDEAQVAYGTTAVGQDKRPYGGAKHNSRYFQAIKKIHDQGRAVNVTTWEGTQDPTDKNLPARSREGNHIRASLVLGTESQSRMALGDAPVNAGAAPHKLRQGLDKGTLVVNGDGVDTPPGLTFTTIRTHYIGPQDATELAERAKARRKPVTTRDATEDEPQQRRDLLEDLLEVIGDADERIPTGDIPALLRDLAPDWPAYQDLRPGELRKQLAALGIEVPSTANRYPLDPAAVRRAAVRRGPADADLADDDE
jgi:S-DNA-T family DNA segregation ATPase FtsK/SpoIIIE